MQLNSFECLRLKLFELFSYENALSVFSRWSCLLQIFSKRKKIWNLLVSFLFAQFIILWPITFQLPILLWFSLPPLQHLQTLILVLELAAPQPDSNPKRSASLWLSNLTLSSSSSSTFSGSSTSMKVSTLLTSSMSLSHLLRDFGVRSVLRWKPELPSESWSRSLRRRPSPKASADRRPEHFYEIIINYTKMIFVKIKKIKVMDEW